MHTAARPFLERVAALDRAIRAGEFPNAVILADRLEVSRRTVQRDIEFLRDRLEVPLAYDEVRHGFYYTDPSTPGWCPRSVEPWRGLRRRMDDDSPPIP